MLRARRAAMNALSKRDLDAARAAFDAAMAELSVAEAGLQSFDILPLIPIVERAGGIVTTWEGGDPREGGRILAAGDKRLHAEAVKLLSG
jgi:fructose-1,6-bisphosphatase/inositol monophosphatase family enzyme